MRGYLQQVLQLESPLADVAGDPPSASEGVGRRTLAK